MLMRGVGVELRLPAFSRNRCAVGGKVTLRRALCLATGGAAESAHLLEGNDAFCMGLWPDLPELLSVFLSYGAAVVVE